MRHNYIRKEVTSLDWDTEISQINMNHQDISSYRCTSQSRKDQTLKYNTMDTNDEYIQGMTVVEDSTTNKKTQCNGNRYEM